MIAEIILASAITFGRPVDMGGSVAITMRAIQSAHGVHPIAGDCGSACVLWVGYRKACIERDAELWIHAAVTPSGHIAPPWLALAMYRKASKRFADFAEPFLASVEPVGVPGWQAIRLGVRACK